MTTPDQIETRVLPRTPVDTLTAYVDGGGGAGLAAAALLGPDAVVEHLTAAGLRGRGGAGFPTGRKWAAVRSRSSTRHAATVVVNAAEGEPGSYKDRAILRANPFAVLEGALIAASTVGADRVVIALRASFDAELAIVHGAIDAVRAAGWLDTVDVTAFAGPEEYLYGEETALLEALEGRPPFPRVAPPYRHGVEEVGTSGSPEPAQVEMADGTDAPPTLVDNLETLANVPGILAAGPEWYREVGTAESPGTIVCTVTGDTERHGVAEVPMGTPLRAVIEQIGGSPGAGRRIAAVMSGIANPLLDESQLDTPVSYEGMQAIGSGLGNAAFIVFDDATDFATVAHGVSRFLSVESCGQCTPCKQDGLALTALLDGVRQSDAEELDLVAIADRLRTVADSARCSLATQHQVVVGSILERFGDSLRAHVRGDLPAAASLLVAPIVRFDGDVVVIDEREAAKQPDWTYDEVDSAKTPAERLATASPDSERAAPG
jgi:NADH-quinone oxidoreductase subunit F